MAPNNFRPRRMRHPDSKTARFLRGAAAGAGILLALWSFEIAGGATQPAVREGAGEPESSAQVLGPSGGFVGAATCGECHQARFKGFQQTAHHLTSRWPSRKSLLGDSAGSGSIMRTRNHRLKFEMSEEGGAYYQTAVSRAEGVARRRTHRVGIVIGSGKIAQTFLYWHEAPLRIGDRPAGKLFELPVSYFRARDRWMNSPGYVDGEANFERPIRPRCLECHSTYFESASYENNVYAKDNIILGNSCEKCHGAGARHVEYHRSHPDAYEGRHIVHPGKLDRNRVMELCGQCHGGVGTPLQKPFSFRAGETLAAYYTMEEQDEQNEMGVHSTNQFARLSRSRCFQESEVLTCATCHNPHVFERGNAALFSERCMKCHDPHACGMAEKLGKSIESNCIDCHMPRKKDIGTGFQTRSGFEFPLMPEHLVAVYPEASRRFEAGLNRGSKKGLGSQQK